MPECLVESELNNAMEQIKQNLVRSGSNKEKAGLDEGKLREDLAPASERKVKEMLILGEIAKKEDLTVDEAELSEGFREMSLSIGQEPETLRKYYEANGFIETFREKLLEEKTLNYLVKGAKIIEKVQVETDKIK